MKTKKLDPQSLKQDEVAENKNEIDPEVHQQKPKTVKKRKHVSALVAASMGRSAVIEALPWNKFLSQLLRNNNEIIRTNSLVLLHEIATKTKALAKTTTALNNSFISKRDFTLLLEAEGRHNILSHVLKEALLR